MTGLSAQYVFCGCYSSLIVQWKLNNNTFLLLYIDLCVIVHLS